ncbi:hypothetical protein [Variovorax beijingensis]|uniref:hypothetical protein n=1 Tax=Variovorax beijingensis TaxID=2496117 RepID=UPI00163A6217|nr:hypothetical protein [Variovorax beijingensis]
MRGAQSCALQVLRENSLAAPGFSQFMLACIAIGDRLAQLMLAVRTAGNGLVQFALALGAARFLPAPPVNIKNASTPPEGREPPAQDGPIASHGAPEREHCP